jgi:hypothetical protein
MHGDQPPQIGCLLEQSAYLDIGAVDTCILGLRRMGCPDMQTCAEDKTAAFKESLVGTGRNIDGATCVAPEMAFKMSYPKSNP